MTRSQSSPQSAAPRRQRIAKLMARAGLCSRRDAEAWIVAGRVSLNGNILTSPAVDVSPEDAVLVDGQKLPAIEKTRLFLFHKPRGLVTTDHDPEGRPTVADFLRTRWPDAPRVVTVGRLDINTEGLLLLTNDGGLARVLELPQTGWVRRYRVRAKGAVDPARLDALSDGLTIDGIAYAGIEATLDRVQGANAWLTMGLREGKNREIKRVLEHLGLEVNRLIRLSFGPFQLLDLPDGAVEEVRTRVLREQLGPSLAAQAGAEFGALPAEATPPRQAQRPVAPRPHARAHANDEAPRPRREPPDRGKRSPDPRRSREPGRDRPSGSAEVSPKREKPKAGSRKHVSTLRAERQTASRTGPRVRLERSDTRDRRDRVVEVERRSSVDAGAPAQRRANARRPVERAFDAERPPAPRANNRRRESETAEDKPRRAVRSGPHGSSPNRDRTISPSAAGKRARIARSGAPGRGGQADRRDRPPEKQRRAPATPSKARKPDRRADRRGSPGASETRRGPRKDRPSRRGPPKAER